MHTLIRKLSFGCAILLPFAFSLSPALNARMHRTHKMTGLRMYSSSSVNI